MRKRYFEAIYPAQDGRDVPREEKVAKLAAKIIDGNDDLIWHAESQGIEVPVPNKSARIYSRQKVGANEWVTVEASAEFFLQVEEFASELALAGFPS